MPSSESVIIESTGLVKKFTGVEAIAGVTLSLRCGEVVCLIGPNGAGKSTLLYLLGGLLLPSAGHVTVFGMHRWKQNHEIRCRSILLPATPVYGGNPTPWEYLRYVAQVYRLPKDHFLSRVQRMADEMDYHAYLNREWGKLSLGLTKKAGLMAAFLPDVDLRIMDEPFAGGIDPLGMEVLFRWIGAARARGETILFSTQVLEQAQDASDRLILLHKGRVAADGTPDAIIRQAGIDPSEPRALAKAFVQLAVPLEAEERD